MFYIGTWDGPKVLAGCMELISKTVLEHTSVHMCVCTHMHTHGCVCISHMHMLPIVVYESHICKSYVCEPMCV